MAIDAARASAAEVLSREQFDLFYRATAATLRSYICRVSGNSTTADDILQEAYVRLLNVSLAPEARKSYLYRTATNLIIDQRRAQARRERWTWLMGRRAQAAESQVELTSDMDRLFAQISQRERAMLWLAYVDGADHQEIAAILGLRPASVKVLLFRARRKMESILRKHGYE
jgi:RNA polymerase sigma-70 factor (ECF subfamily)